MNEKPMTVHKVAEITGVTVRTLHYYDEIGLIKPEIVADNGYRLYTRYDLERLQEILFFREAGFALKEIKKMVTSKAYDREEALKRHLQILESHKSRIEGLIALVKKRISGIQEYSFGEFSSSEIYSLQDQYRKEVSQRWGETESYREFVDSFGGKVADFRHEKWDKFPEESADIFKRLAEYEGADPSCMKVQGIVREWKEYISANFYRCDNKMLGYLGELYTSDKRFSDFINRFGKGDLASLFYEAIKIFCSLNED